MREPIGPHKLSRIVLCSADASPDSQKEGSGQAGYFFPRGRWVGAVRNVADEIGCRFLILTTGHGLVDSSELIDHYDVHIDSDPLRVDLNWRRTIPQRLGKGEYDVLVFYTGGCPRNPYIEMLKPKIRAQKISLLVFGKPNMGDAGKIMFIVQKLIVGTSLSELRESMNFPDNLEFFNS